MIAAGHERARRNLPDTWALMRSPPLVSLGPSGLGRTVGGRRAPDAMGPVHRMRADAPGLSTGRPHRAPVSAAGRPVARVERVELAAIAGQDEPPADQLGPDTTSECATRQATVPSGSMANVSSSAWTMTWASRDEPSRAMIGVAGPMVPAGLAGRRRPGRTCGTRSSRRAGPRCRGGRPRGSSLIVEAKRAVQAPARSLEAQLGAAQRLGVLGDARCRARSAGRRPRTGRRPQRPARCRPSASGRGGRRGR